MTAISPFFFNVTANRLQREGEMPWSGHDVYAVSGTPWRLPLPIDDHTTNANALFGWKNKQFYAALGGGFSEYGNEAEFTRFQDPFTTGATQAYRHHRRPSRQQVVDPQFHRHREAPPLLRVCLERRLSEKHVPDDAPQYDRDRHSGGPHRHPLRLSQPTFNGDVEYFNVGANLTSNPVKDLTTKLYFKYLDRRDKSDRHLHEPLDSRIGLVTNSLFSYNKTSVGAEATYRFLKNLKGILGYDFTDTRREGGEDFLTSPIATALSVDNVPRTVDNTFRAQMVYNPFDWLGTRLKYQKLYRGTDTELQPGTAANIVLAEQHLPLRHRETEQDMFKLTADISPVDDPQCVFRVRVQARQLQQHRPRLAKAEENEFIVDGELCLERHEVLRLLRLRRLLHRADREGGRRQRNPNTAPTTTAFNWNANQHNNNYAYGAGTTFPIIKNKLAFIVQYDFEQNNGTANFTSQSFTAAHTALGVNNGNIDIGPWDDYTRQNISARLVYDYNKNFGLIFGFLYSQFRLNDGQLNGYQYVAPGPSYLSGAYTDGSYKANVYYVRAVYRF